MRERPLGRSGPPEGGLHVSLAEEARRYSGRSRTRTRHSGTPRPLAESSHFGQAGWARGRLLVGALADLAPA
jgi:hypothetical protein